jgi:two-component system, chemotaxis family, chemotaxis protein CheY
MGKLDLSIKILVVDDVMSMRHILRRALNEIGFTDIQDATNGEDALTKLKTGRFGLLLLDWNMPVMTGIDLLRAIRSDPDFRSLLVLMVTAEAKGEQIMEAVQAGVSDYLVKPFSTQVLQEKLEKLFQKTLPK